MDNNIVQPVPQTEPTQINPISSSENQEKNSKKFVKVNFKINLKIVIIIIVVIALLVLAYLYKGLLIAATVNGSPISRLSVIHTLEKDSGKDLLDSLIQEKLIQQEAKVKNIIVTNDQIDAEIKKVEAQLAAQGQTLSTALANKNITLAEYRNRVILQKDLEGILADKIIVTDQEVAQYIKDNKISVTKGEEATINEQVKTQLQNQKLNKEADALITDLKAKANIQYFVKY